MRGVILDNVQWCLELFTIIFLERHNAGMPNATTSRHSIEHQLCPFKSVADYACMGIRNWNACDDEWLDATRTAAQFSLRRQFIKDFGYVIASAEVMAVLVELLQNLGPVLDAGCGSGYLSQELTRLGVTTYAVDTCDFREERPTGRGYPIKSVYQLDALGDAAAFVSGQFGAVLLTWPPYDKPFALNVAQAMRPGQILVYEGEAAGGCTGDAAFFKYMSDSARWAQLTDVSTRLNEVHVTWASLHDHWTVWRRLD